MADPTTGHDAPLAPADHALAHALSIHMLSITAEQGWDAILVDAMDRIVADDPPGPVNSSALRLRDAAAGILNSLPGSSARCRAEIEARAALIGFHKWRLGLALERGEKVA